MIELIGGYFSKFGEFPRGFIDPHDLMHWQWFVWNLIAVAVLSFLFSKNKKRSFRRLSAHIRSRRARHEASLDIQFFILKILYQPLKILLLLPFFVFVAKVSTDSGMSFMTWVGGGQSTLIAGPFAHALKALWVLMAYDFAYYWSHRVQHQVCFFWHLHSVHHRSTYLTPLLKYRTHPFDTLVNNIFSFTLGAFAMGVFNSLYHIEGAKSEFDLVYLGFSFFSHFVFGHIRHSVYWISYGRFLSRIFISPAMHQIHHSTALQHQGKNLGTMFSLWDLIFGTIYIPQKREVLKFGDSPRIRNEKKTLWKEVKDPMILAMKSLTPYPKRWWQVAALLSAMIIVGLASCAKAESSCRELRDLVLPAALIEYLSHKNKEQVYLPAPLSRCFGDQGSVRLLDPYGKTMGQFFPEKKWSGSFAKIIEKIPENQIALDYIKEMSKEGASPRGMVQILMRLLFPQEFREEGPFQIWRGRFVKSGYYYFDAQNLKQEPLMQGPSDVGYANLIKGIESGKAVYSYIEAIYANEWRIPTTKFALELRLDSYSTKLIPLVKLQGEASAYEARAKTECEKAGAIIYGPIGVDIAFFNVYDWLRASGCQNISWFSGGYLEWQFPEEKEEYLAEQKGEVIVDGEAVKTRSKDTLLVDLRDSSQYAEAHIPGALNFPLLDWSQSKFWNAKLRANYFTFSDKDYAELINATKGKRMVIFYTRQKDIMTLQSLKRLVHNFQIASKTNAKFYLGGFRDWQSRSQWLGETEGYKIASAAKSK